MALALVGGEPLRDCGSRISRGQSLVDDPGGQQRGPQGQGDALARERVVEARCVAHQERAGSRQGPGFHRKGTDRPRQLGSRSRNPSTASVACR